MSYTAIFDESLLSKPMFDGIETLFDYEDTTPKNKAELPEGVIGRMKGHATFHGDKTLDNRNKHFYHGRSKSGMEDGFWDEVLKDNAVVKEKLVTKSFFGSANHPNLDKEPPVPGFLEASHCITKYEINDDGVKIWVDILDTPSGRILDVFRRYGTKMGVSTRAYGESDIDKNGYKHPILDKYLFITWDFVTFPAFPLTRLTDNPKNDDVEIDETTKKAILDEILKIVPAKLGKQFCDYFHVDYKKPVSEDKKILDEALEIILKLKEEKKALEDKLNVDGSTKNFDKFLEGLQQKVETNDWSKVDMTELKASSELLEAQFEAERKELYSNYDELQQQAQALVLKGQELENKLVDMEIAHSLDMQKLTDTYESEITALDQSLNEYESNLSVAIQITDDMSEDYQKTYDELVIVQSEVKRLKDEVFKLRSLLKSKEVKPVQDSVSIPMQSVSFKNTSRPMFGVVSEIKESVTDDFEMEGLDRTLKKVKQKN